MATISTSQDLDFAARAAGEAFTVQSNAVLTINTDTRWHKNAVWSTGSIGSLTLTAATGGKVLIDARNVRWIPYNGGTGNVPALGSTITGSVSGVTGELLGVYSALNVAPTAVAAAMPATGFIKFKSTSGTFNVAEALTGIGASTNGTQVVGWIEVVMDDASGTTCSRPCMFQTRGDWFYLANTTGVAAQVIQCPNPGGANFYVPGVWIETGVGTNVYEFWPAIQGTTYFGTSHLGLDARSKFVQCIGSGQIRIGNNGSVNVGFVPPSGCKVRIPNILLKSCATASRASDSVPSATMATRPDFTTTSAGQIDIEYTIGHWYFSFAQPYSVLLKHSAWFDGISITEVATPIVLTEAHNGNYTHADAVATTLTSNLAGGTYTNCKWGRTGTIASADYGTSMSYCRDTDFIGCHFADRAFRTNAGGYAFYGAYSQETTFLNTVLVGHAIYLLSCIGATVTNTQYADSFHTTSSGTTPPLGCIMFAAGCVDVTADGLSWYTAVANVHPDTAIFYATGATNVKFRNVGTRTVPLSGGSSNLMLYAVRDGGNNVGVEVKRVYCSNVATFFYNGVNSSKGVEVTNCSGDYADVQGSSGILGFCVLDGVVKGLAVSAAYTVFTSVYGTIFYNIYTSTSAGRLGIMMNEDTELYAAYVTKSFTGASGFTSTGTLAIQVLNDWIIYEYPYWIYGVDSFQNAAVVLAGTLTGNHTVEYQIDTGSGWNGSWKAATGANLSGESFTAAGGFRFKIRITCNTASATNALTACYFLTNANTTAQDVQYPLEPPVTVKQIVKSLSTGLAIENARVRLMKVSDSTVVLEGLTSASGILQRTDWEYTADVPIYGWARKATGSPLYKEGYVSGTIEAGGYSATVLLILDE